MLTHAKPHSFPLRTLSVPRLVMFKYENLWALKLAKETRLWTPRLILRPRASMTLGVPVLISSAKTGLRSLSKVSTKF